MCLNNFVLLFLYRYNYFYYNMYLIHSTINNTGFSMLKSLKALQYLNKIQSLNVPLYIIFGIKQ